MQNILIRATTAVDAGVIAEVHARAFGYGKEAELTAALLQDQTAEPMVSLLAFANNEPAGHILFTKAALAGNYHSPLMHILAPMAVLPEFQRKGIGGRLIMAGLKQLQDMGSQMVFVLGHKEYYPKYGFRPHAMEMGYPAPYDIPEKFSEYWMLQPLGENGFNLPKGRVSCADTLNKPEHWRDDEADRA